MSVIIIMLITINLHDKQAYLYRMFNDLWSGCVIECRICFERITDDGVIVVSDHATLNLEKMFHVDCLNRWYASTANKHRDPFNRCIKYKFNFPPKSLEECSAMLNQIKGFIGDERADKQYAVEFERVQNVEALDVELDFDKLLTY
ncbi:ac53 [Artaxa digramma nucleopolyhedrovirus]|uniref:Ac53 n=1 Tax=Artaxa digramma nucleopolyhedrovirus TaxID=3070910 RepID=A0AAE6R6C1_9ABAC|nr:ac53 [Euproctis digramma nucleopolyhedrovirus]QHB21688.1 ac53 [Artaxa digramma nucleopolyhedrovirus]